MKCSEMQWSCSVLHSKKLSLQNSLHFEIIHFFITGGDLYKIIPLLHTIILGSTLDCFSSSFLFHVVYLTTEREILIMHGHPISFFENIFM